MSTKHLTKELKNELMMYDAEQDKIHILNRVARLIHELHSAGKQLDEIEAAIRAQFKTKSAVDIRADVRRCLAELRTKGLIPASDDAQ